MGTHPIFESDFDCLTVNCKLGMQARNLIKRVNPCRIVSQRQMRSEPWQGESLIEIGTRTIFSEEHDMFRESVRRFLDENVTMKEMDKWEEQGMVDREIWLKAGEQGLLGVDTPDELGGLGGDFLMSCIVSEEISYNGTSALGWSLHSDIVMPYISKYGTDEQKALLPSMVAGEKIGCIAMTEPGTGSDLQGLKTTAKKDGADYVINGSKVFISNGYMADIPLIAAVTDPQAKNKAAAITLFVVDTATPGFQRGKLLKKVGLKGQDTAELFFEDMRVPASAILGGEDGLNQGFSFLMQELARERLLIGVQSQAMLEGAFERTRDYTKDRMAFGKPLIKLQTIQHRLAEVKTDAAVGRAFCDRAMQLFMEDNLDYTTASMAKYWLSEKAHTNISKCLQLFGGWGYMWEYPIARYYADSRAGMIYGGANEIMKELIARPIMH